MSEIKTVKQTPEFLELEAKALKAEKELYECLSEIQRRFPVEGGRRWCTTLAGEIFPFTTVEEVD